VRVCACGTPGERARAVHGSTWLAPLGACAEWLRVGRGRQQGRVDRQPHLWPTAREPHLGQGSRSCTCCDDRSEAARFRSPDGADCCWSHGSCYLYDRSAGYLPTLYIEHTHSLSLTYSRFNCIYHTFHSIPCHSTTTTTSLDSEHLMIVVDSIESQLQEPTDQLRARARVPLGRRRRHCTRNARLVATSAMQRAP